MGLHQPVVFPLFGILQTPDGPRCACGDEKCGRIGKHPRVAWGDLAFGDAVPRPDEGAGAGLKTGAAPKGSGIFVVDLDSEEAADRWDELCADDPEVNTMEVATGRGWQLYFQHPGFPVRNSAGDLGKGIDIRGDGGFVVAPGSPHKNGKTYTVTNDIPPMPAPNWLLEWLKARPVMMEIHHYSGDVTDPEERAYRREVYVDYLKKAPPCIQGSNGDGRLFDVVQHGAYDLALPTEDVLALVTEHYDPRCEPPWGDALPERVAHKAHSAKTSSTRPRAEPPPRALAHVFGGLEMPPIPEGGLTDLPPKPSRKSSSIVWGEWDEPIDPPTWLVHSLIPVETVGMFVAMGSSLKTWTALDIGIAVAKGVPWLGRYDTRGPMRVLVVDFESGGYELRRRVKNVLRAGRVNALGAWSYPSGEGSRIDDERFWKTLATVDGGAPGFVIVDSLAAGAPGVDENDARVAMPLKMAARYTEATGGSVLFIHHSRKDDGGDDRKMVRGSTAIYADCDWAYKFENVEETQAYRRMHMVCIKPSMGPKPPPVHLELSDEKGLTWFDEEGAKAVIGKERTPEAIEAAIRLALEGRPIETIDDLAKAVGVRKELVGPRLKAMEVRREVSKIKGLGYVLDGDDARRQRVRELVQGYAFWKSEAAIAKAAAVDTADVERMVRDAILAKSAEGRWLAFD